MLQHNAPERRQIVFRGLIMEQGTPRRRRCKTWVAVQQNARILQPKESDLSQVGRESIICGRGVVIVDFMSRHPVGTFRSLACCIQIRIEKLDEPLDINASLSEEPLDRGSTYPIGFVATNPAFARQTSTERFFR